MKPKKRETEVKQKLKEFAEHKLVITDRLHGMIFVAITNTPCIAMGNLNGKVKNVYRWIQDIDYIQYAEKADNVANILKALDLDKQYHFDHSHLDKYYKPLEDELKDEK